MKDTLRDLGFLARDNPHLRRQIGIVIDVLKNLAACPDRPGLRTNAARDIARLAELRRLPDGGETWPIGG